MEKYRDSFGFINIEQMNIEDVQYLRDNKKIFSFWYEGKKYFFKEARHVDFVYNELVAAEIAKQYGINYVTYDLASNFGQIGVISENFFQANDEYLSMEYVLKNYFKEERVDNHNNLEEIWIALDFYFKDYNLVAKLMDQIVDIFLFDILIGNIDRHVENIGFIKRGNQYFLTPAFDNELMLSYPCLLEGIYALGVDSDDYFPFANDYVKVRNFLDKFLAVSDSRYLDRLRSKLYLISDDNIENILTKIETSLNFKMNEYIREEIGDNFVTNRKMITSIINKYTEMKLIKKGNA